MKLFDLLEGVKIVKTNALDIDINTEYITNDHRKTVENTVFIAIKGTKRNGNDYVKQAIEKGAIAIVTDEEKSIIQEFPYILVDNTREALAKMWSNFYGNPSKNIKTVAITGTNGKTSSALFLYNILCSAKIPTALISTIGCYINGNEIDVNGGGSVTDISSAMTTPDPETLYYLYNKMKENNIKVAIIEVSSHAIAQKRLCGISMEIGAFTNLSREHLDFHGSMEDYFCTKEELFKICKAGIVNIDDKYGQRIKSKNPNIYGYSTKDETDFLAKEVVMNANGCKYLLAHNGVEIKIETKMIGEFTVYNSLLAASCALLLEIDKSFITEGIATTKSIKGRLEKYHNKNIYIDYAHTPEAMKNVILSVKQIEDGKRLIVLFGCGGDRDAGKRAEMGEICTKYADYTVITSDNPRSEDPQKIIEDILVGVDERSKFTVIENRREAIIKTAKKLKENDVLLLLGKGHEEYEITKNGKQYFSEKSVLNEVFHLDK